MMEKESRKILSNKRMLGAWIVSAWLLFLFILMTTWAFIPEGLTQDIDSLSTRFIFASAHIFCASLLLFLGFLAVGATRWHIETENTSAYPAYKSVTSENNSSTSNIHNRVHVQFLSNTTEQFVMFATALLAATPFLSQPYLRLITLMTVLWIFGRLFFWIGYWYTATHQLPTYPRAIGLGMGLLCTLTLAAIAVIGICLHFPSFSSVIEYSTIIPTSVSFSFSDILIQADMTNHGSNLLPIIFFSIIIAMVSFFAVFPRIAPPVIPIALISVIGWIVLLISGVIPIR